MLAGFNGSSTSPLPNSSNVTVNNGLVALLNNGGGSSGLINYNTFNINYSGTSPAALMIGNNGANVGNVVGFMSTGHRHQDQQGIPCRPASASTVRMPPFRPIASRARHAYAPPTRIRPGKDAGESPSGEPRRRWPAGHAPS